MWFAKFLIIVWFGAISSALHANQATFRALEDRLSERLAAYDRDAIDQMWDDRLTFVFPSGHVASKAERLAKLVRPLEEQGAALVSHNDAVDIVYEDRQMAITIVHSTWRLGGIVQGGPYVATHVWIRRGQRWRLLAAQVAQGKPG